MRVWEEGYLILKTHLLEQNYRKILHVSFLKERICSSALAQIAKTVCGLSLLRDSQKLPEHLALGDPSNLNQYVIQWFYN